MAVDRFGEEVCNRLGPKLKVCSERMLNKESRDKEYRINAQLKRELEQLMAAIKIEYDRLI